MGFNSTRSYNVFNNFFWLDHIKKSRIWNGELQMNEFYIGLGIGIGVVLIVDWVYYFKYLNQKKNFEEKEGEMLKRLDDWFEQHKK